MVRPKMARAQPTFTKPPNIYERAAVKTYEALRSDRSPAALGRFSRKHLFAVKRHEQVQQVPGNQLTYLDGYKLGTPSHLLGRGLPQGRRPVGFLSLDDPESCLGQVTSHRTHSDGMAFAV